MPIPPYPKGAPIKVSFLHTPDGIVHVEVFDLTANRQLGAMVIKRDSNKTAEQVKASEDRLAGTKSGQDNQGLSRNKSENGGVI